MIENINVCTCGHFKDSHWSVGKYPGCKYCGCKQFDDGQHNPILRPKADTHLRDSICEAIAHCTPFSYDAVFYAHDKLKSFDAVIAACDYAAIYGCSVSLGVHVILAMKENEIELPAERLEILE